MLSLPDTSYAVSAHGELRCDASSRRLLPTLCGTGSLAPALLEIQRYLVMARCIMKLQPQPVRVD